MYDDQEDAEANYFAMCLLMPEHFVRKDIEAMLAKSPLCFDDPRIDQMAKRYKVDVKLLMLRLGQLGYMKV